MYEVPFKKDAQLIVLMSEPYKSALKRLALRSGTDMSDIVRIALAEYISNHHYGEFNQIYDEEIRDFVKNKENK